MIVRIESTTKTVEIAGGVPARVWEGFTESGIPVVMLITRIAVQLESDRAQFEEELSECRPPTAAADVFPSRLIL